MLSNNQYDLSRDILAYCSYLAKHHIIPLKMSYCTFNSQQDFSKSADFRKTNPQVWLHDTFCLKSHLLPFLENLFFENIC